jgi:uncharacterized iron-regulated membrane protein
MLRLRSIRNQLTILFSAITLVAVAGVYLYVVPQLESNLRSQKLRGLAQSAREYSGDLVRAIGSNVEESRVNQAVRTAADRANVRVTGPRVCRPTPSRTRPPRSHSAGSGSTPPTPPRAAGAR